MNRSIIRFILALIAITMGGLIVGALVYVPIPESNREALLLALGLVLGWGGAVFGYYFGTSESSAQKSDLLAERPTGRVDDPVHVEEE